MKKSLSIATAALAVLGSAFSTGAYALDQKIFPGAVCKAQIAGSDNHIYDSTDGSIYNHGNERLLVVCPLTRDKVDRKLESLYVYVYDFSTSGGVKCSFRNPKVTGSGLVATGYRYSGTYATGYRTLSFRDYQVPGSNAYGSYLVACVLDKNTKLVSLQLVEQ